MSRNHEIKSLALCSSIVSKSRDCTRGHSQGGGYGGRNPPIGPSFLVIFTKTPKKTMFGRVSAALPHPQNPLIWHFLASKPPP